MGIILDGVDLLLTKQKKDIIDKYSDIDFGDRIITRKAYYSTALKDIAGHGKKYHDDHGVYPKNLLVLLYFDLEADYLNWKNNSSTEPSLDTVKGIFSFPVYIELLNPARKKD